MHPNQRQSVHVPPATVAVDDAELVAGQLRHLERHAAHEPHERRTVGYAPHRVTAKSRQGWSPPPPKRVVRGRPAPLAESGLALGVPQGVLDNLAASGANVADALSARWTWKTEGPRVTDEVGQGRPRVGVVRVVV
jgi:hypothetical protein